MFEPRRPRARIVLATACLAIFAVAARAEDPPMERRSRLDLVQAEIATYSHMEAGEVAGQFGRFRQLVVDYIRAYEPLVQKDCEFSIMNERSWA